MKDVDFGAEVEELYEKLFLILDENSKSLLRKIRLKCMEKVKHLHDELEDDKNFIEIYKEDITEYEKDADTLKKDLEEMVDKANQ
jgi:hypothetical protein